MHAFCWFQSMLDMIWYSAKEELGLLGALSFIANPTYLEASNRPQLKTQHQQQSNGSDSSSFCYDVPLLVKQQQLCKIFTRPKATLSKIPVLRTTHSIQVTHARNNAVEVPKNVTICSGFGAHPLSQTCYGHFFRGVTAVTRGMLH